MLKRMLAASALVATLALGAHADDDDKIMGNYQGAFASKGWEATPIRAEVIAMSKIAWRINLYIGGEDGAEKKFELPAKLDKGTPVVDGTVELKGEYKVSGTLKDETFVGKLDGKDQDGEFTLKRVMLQSPTLGKPMPEGGISLLDGTNIATNWVRTPEQWCMQADGSMEVCSSSLMTKQEFGDAEYHIEFMCPFKANARDQERGNSGVYFMGRYEVQVLDNFGDATADNWCGGIYKRARPITNASLPPLTWQTYDVTFIAPKFDASGNKVSDAEITVLHNGKLIHDKVKLSGPTPGGVSDVDGPKGPILLQDHDNPVRYKNIWVKPIK